MRKVVLIGLLFLVVFSSGCVDQTSTKSKKTQKVYGLGNEIIIGEGGYEIGLVIDNVVVREISIGTGESREYSVEEFDFYESGVDGTLLFVQIKIEGVGYKATGLPSPRLILTDVYDEEFNRGGTYFSKGHKRYSGNLSVEYNKKEELMGRYPLIEHTEFLKSARLQIERENEIIVIPLKIENLIESKRSVDYKEPLPAYCYLNGPSWKADGVFLNITGKMNSMQKNTVTPNKIYTFITECLRALDFDIEMKGNFPDGELCYKGNCTKMYLYEKENIVVPEVITDEGGFVQVKNSFCWDLRTLVSSAKCQTILGDHKVTVGKR